MGSVLQYIFVHSQRNNGEWEMGDTTIRYCIKNVVGRDELCIPLIYI